MVPETCEENLVAQAAMTKVESDNRTKVFVCELLIRSKCEQPDRAIVSDNAPLRADRNMVKALP